MWIRNYKHSEDIVRWWLFFPKALAFVISPPLVFRKGYFQMVLPSFVTLPFHPPPPPPLKPLSNSWDVWESLSAIMSDVGSVYNTCAKGMKSGKICSDFAFTVVKIYTIFFFWGNRWPSYVCDYIGNNVHSFFVWSPTQNIFAYISSIPK